MAIGKARHILALADYEGYLHEGGKTIPVLDALVAAGVTPAEAVAAARQMGWADPEDLARDWPGESGQE